MNFTVEQSTRHIVCEINNLAVQLHKSGLHSDASTVYQDALHAITALVEIRDQEGGSPASYHQFEHAWVNKLIGHRSKYCLERNCTSKSASKPQHEQLMGEEVGPVSIEADGEGVQDEDISAGLLHNMGLLAVLSGEDSFARAEGLLRMCIGLVGKGTEFHSLLSVSAHNALARVCAQSGNFRVALENIMAALSFREGGALDQNHVMFGSALRLLGTLLTEAGHVQDGMLAFDAAAAIYSAQHQAVAEKCLDMDAFFTVNAAAPAA